MAIKSNKDVSIRSIFEIPIFVGHKTELLEFLSGRIEKKREMTVVFTPNPEQITLSFHSLAFKHALQSSSINLPDGYGLVWALKRHGETRVTRIPGREVFKALMALSKEKAWKVFLLGGRPGSASILAERYGAGFNPGSDNIQAESDAERSQILSEINEYHPDILFVAYGAPWQELWVEENRVKLEKAGIKLVMVVGGSFDYEAGMVAKVPRIFEQLHLEWLWRLMTEPWRWQRQLKGLEFFKRVLLNQMRSLV